MNEIEVFKFDRDLNMEKLKGNLNLITSWDNFFIRSNSQNALYSQEKMPNSQLYYAEKIFDYYKDVDNLNYEKVKDLFDFETSVYPTNYRRGDDIFFSKEDIDDFYSENGRTLKGNHLIDRIYATKGLVFSFGKFIGSSKIQENLDIDFCDFWHFENSGQKVAERRTYLLRAKNIDEIKAMIDQERKNQFKIDPTSIETRTLILELENSELLFQQTGGEHFGLSLPNLDLFTYGVPNSKLCIYSNSNGELIR